MVQDWLPGDEAANLREVSARCKCQSPTLEVRDLDLRSAERLFEPMAATSRQRTGRRRAVVIFRVSLPVEGDAPTCEFRS